MSDKPFDIAAWLEATDNNFDSNFDWIAWYENTVKEFDYEKFFEAIKSHDIAMCLKRKLKHDKYWMIVFRIISFCYDSIFSPPASCCLLV